MISEPKHAPASRIGLAGLGMAMFAVGCCAGLPLLIALAGGVAVGTVGGGVAGALVLGGLAALVTLKVRRRRACTAPAVEPRRWV